jgi:5-methylcytosine-specific restriction endonuclease McrA
MPRKSLSKSLRFEIFKRDSFTCQYCGGKAPEVLLHVDHIEPVSKGGGNDLLNLITSCEPCNAGKSDRRLADNTAVEKNDLNWNSCRPGKSNWN